jgi:hypothetical protein
MHILVNPCSRSCRRQEGRQEDQINQQERLCPIFSVLKQKSNSCPSH